MNIVQLRIVPITVLMCVSLFACSRSLGEHPAVSEANCTAEKIAKIDSEPDRKEFAGLCARRNTFKPSPKVNW